jgi:hypothetical protein
LLKEVNFQYAIKALYADRAYDRAYDRHKLYKLCREYDIKTRVLPKMVLQDIQKYIICLTEML